MAVESVHKASLQQVQYLHCAVTRTSDHEVAGRVKGEAVDCCSVDCFRRHTQGTNAVSKFESHLIKRNKKIIGNV